MNDAEPADSPPRRWASHLDALARAALTEAPLAASNAENLAYLDRFTDEMGNRRPVDRPLIAHVLGIDPGPTPNPLSPDLALWWALHDPAVELAPSAISGEGPLVPGLHAQGIETWTEAELCALHALWRHAERRNSSSLRERCLSAVAWHLAELQPDNGTNRPWAVHAFVLAAPRLPGAIFHAQTLVHNACVQFGRPDRLSAFILLDAADALNESSQPA